jgi:hypothetical protein
MDQEVLRHWARDASDMLHAIAVVWEQEEADDAELIRLTEERHGKPPVRMAILPESEFLRLRAVYEVCEQGAQVELPEFLDWLACRMIHVHGESPDIDYIRTAKDRATRLRAAMDAYKKERNP